jgi:non-canonical (house-cleaning) NTP pyrophosphatase
MNIHIGSTSEHKQNAVEVVLSEILKEKVHIQTYDVASGVPDTPWNKETFQGAKNRARGIKNINEGICIGLESGLVKRYGNIYEESWACVIKDGVEFYGYSSGLRLPDYVVKRMKDDKLDHGPLMRVIRKEVGSRNDKDTWGLYSNYMLLRQTSLEEALRNALIQVFAPEGNLYSF